MHTGEEELVVVAVGNQASVHCRNICGGSQRKDDKISGPNLFHNSTSLYYPQEEIIYMNSEIVR